MMLAEGLAVVLTFVGAWTLVAAAVAIVMNPLTWIIAGIAALSAGIGWVIEQFGGIGLVFEMLGFGITHFGQLAKVVALEILLAFVSTFNAIVFFFTDTIPALFSHFWTTAKTVFLNIAGYLGAVFSDLAGNLKGIFLDLLDIAMGGRGSHQWKELGSDFEARPLSRSKFVMPTRKPGDFEQTLAEMLQQERGALSRAWDARNKLAAPAAPPFDPNQHGLDPSDPKYRSGGDILFANPELVTDQKVQEEAPVKLSKALAIDSRDAYSAIVNAMMQSRGPTTQERALASQVRQEQHAKRAAEELAKLNAKVDRNTVAVVEDLED
jgi:hypothetical protein